MLANDNWAFKGYEGAYPDLRPGTCAWRSLTWACSRLEHAGAYVLVVGMVWAVAPRGLRHPKRVEGARPPAHRSGQNASPPVPQAPHSGPRAAPSDGWLSSGQEISSSSLRGH